MTEELSARIKDKIRQGVIDPELGINVVDLGLIYEIKTEQEMVHIKMTLTSMGCPYGARLVEDVRQAAEYAAERSVTVELVWQPAWSKQMMSREARDQLLFFS